jgi:hypothetical protein
MFDVYSIMSDWEDYIWLELEANPIVRRQNEQQKTLEDLLLKLENNSTEYFTVVVKPKKFSTRRLSAIRVKLPNSNPYLRMPKRMRHLPVKNWLF